METISLRFVRIPNYFKERNLSSICDCFTKFAKVNTCGIIDSVALAKVNSGEKFQFLGRKIFFLQEFLFFKKSFPKTSQNYYVFGHIFSICFIQTNI